MPRSLRAFALVGSLFWTVVACGSSEPVATTQDPSQSSASAAREDVIRGKGGLEEKCHEAVAEKGTKVVGTNRVEESEAAIEIFVNVEGASAPWRCLGYRDGTIGEVMFTGSEGAL